MASKRVCPHTITLFNFIKEDSDGRALYEATVLKNVHVHITEGVGATDTSSDSTRLHIFDHTYESSKTFAPHSEWILLEPEQRQQHWTLSAQGRDYFALGEFQTDDGLLPGSVTTFRISDVSRLEIGRPCMWHWRAEAR